MTNEIPELYDITIEQLELWNEANVRKENVLYNIDELAGNIKKYGVQMPLLVKEVIKNKKYIIFSGQRRYEASKIANIGIIPCLVYKNINTTRAKILSFSENMYRENMTVDDKSNATRNLFEKFHSIEKVAEVLGIRNVNTVKRYLRYDNIPNELRTYGKKPYDLFAKEIEDIYFQFPDIKKAIIVAKKLSTIKKGTKKRRKMHASIQLSSPSDNIDTLTNRAEKLIRMQTFKIILPDERSKTLEKIAIGDGVSTTDFITKIIENWIDEYLHGRRP